MNVLDTLGELARRGGRLAVRDGRLVFSGPPLDDALRAALLRHRDELVTRLSGRTAPVRGAAPRVDGYLPSFGQRRLLYLDAVHPRSSAYIVAAALHVTGPLDVPRLRRAVTQVVGANAALRTSFVTSVEDGRPQAVVADQMAVELPLTDLSGLEPAQQEAHCATVAVTGFRLDRPPLWRWRLARLAPDRHALVLAMHHTICDGWSLVRAADTVAAGYRHGRLAAEPTDYAEFAAWERDHVAGPAGTAARQHWATRLTGWPTVLDLRVDRTRPTVAGDAGDRVPLPLDASTCAGIRMSARAHGVSVPVFLSCAYAVLLHRWSGRDRVVFGTAVTNRPRPEFLNVFGFFVNWLPIRSRQGPDTTFRTAVRAMRAEHLGAHEHQDLPFDAIARAAGVTAELGRHPVFQHMLVFHVPARRLDMGGLDCAVEPLPNGGAKVDLTVFVTDTAGALPVRGSIGDLFVELEYSTDALSRALVTRIGAAFRDLLQQVVTRPDVPLAELAVDPGPGARPAQATPAFRSVTELIDAQAAHRPHQPALRTGDGTVTYGRLVTLSERLAAGLAARGAGPGQRVAVCMRRSPELVAVLLAVLRTGAAFVPVDRHVPTSRREDALRDAGCVCFVADADAAADAVTLAELLRDPAPAAPTVASRPDDPAYLIYTSGSSGTPKGVLCGHGGLANFAGWLGAFLGTRPGDRVLFKTSVSFDASIREYLAPLTTGACVVVAPDAAHADLPALTRLLDEEVVTVLHAVPSLYAALLDTPGFRGTALRHVVCGGETLPPALVRRHRAVGAGRLHNLYGPTEATVDVTAWTDDGRAELPDVPLGRPVAGHHIELVDTELHPVPPGAPGEILIGGPGIALRYRNRPELTAERFLPDPRQPGKRRYRTGDVGRLGPGGELHFLGRLDRQVQIRGHRVEPEEVERVLADHPDIVAAAVVPAELAGEQVLAAHLVARPGLTGTAVAPRLRSWAARQLLEPMLPRVLHWHDRLPSQTAGKVDLAALTAATAAQEPVAALDAPTVGAVTAIFETVLGAGPVPPEADFFALGGHSLLAVQVVARARADFDIDITMRHLFDNPTAATFASAIGELRGSRAPAGPVLRRLPRGPADEDPP